MCFWIWKFCICSVFHISERSGKPDPIDHLRLALMSFSKSSMSPLTPEERLMLNSLMKRAHHEDALACDASVLSTDSDWNVTAAMSDASKRRQDVSPEGEARVHGYGSFAQTGIPMPSMSFQSFGKTRRGTEIILPEGLCDLAMWGRSVVEFGKYASRNCTYSELAESEEKDVKSYLKWCKSQVDSAEGLLRDFAMYLLAREHRPGQHPVIPGTDHVRKLRVTDC